MKIKETVLVSAAVVALCGQAVFAQSASSTSSSSTNVTGATIQERKKDQQDRVAQGVQSGQLTPGETKNLESKEAGLNKEEGQMRTEDNGKLTAADKAKLTRQQNRMSNQIYTDKHNAAADQFGKGTIGKRDENQQDRIANGIKTGQLTPGEATHVESKEQGLNREVAGMRQEDSGKLSKADRKLVNHQQNQLSKQIYRQKHNGRRGF